MSYCWIKKRKIPARYCLECCEEKCSHNPYAKGRLLLDGLVG